MIELVEAGSSGKSRKMVEGSLDWVDDVDKGRMDWAAGPSPDASKKVDSEPDLKENNNIILDSGSTNWDMDQNGDSPYSDEEGNVADYRKKGFSTGSDPISNFNDYSSADDKDRETRGGNSNHDISCRGRKGNRGEDIHEVGSGRISIRERKKRKKRYIEDIPGPVKIKMNKSNKQTKKRVSKQPMRTVIGDIEGTSLLDGDTKNQNNILREEAIKTLELGIECGMVLRRDKEEMISKLMIVETQDIEKWGVVKNCS